MKSVIVVSRLWAVDLSQDILYWFITNAIIPDNPISFISSKLGLTAIFTQFPTMENFSLTELKSLIEEEIYLIPEDRKAILAKIESDSSAPLKSNLSGMDSIEFKEESPAIVVTTQLPEQQIVAEVPTIEPIPIRGNFTKGVLILHEEAELSAERMEMLVKMINACGHSMNEVGMVNSEKLKGRSMEEFQSINAHTILKFGKISHPINAVPARPYEVYSENETEYLFADSLSMIGEDVNLKKKLWTSLQVLFNLSNSKK